jgi:hypothetical protein
MENRTNDERPTGPRQQEGARAVEDGMGSAPLGKARRGVELAVFERPARGLRCPARPLLSARVLRWAAAAYALALVACVEQARVGPPIHPTDAGPTRDFAKDASPARDFAQDGGATGPQREPIPRPLRWRRRVLDDAFRAESVAVFDVDGDGHLDLVTDQRWYPGPSFATFHEVGPQRVFDPAPQYSRSFASFAYDVDEDGDLDLLVVRFPGDPMDWLENPGPAGGHWPAHRLAHSVANESPAFAPLRPGAPPSLVAGELPEQRLVALRPGANRLGTWDATEIAGPSAPGAGRFAHGLGVGDVNGDGRPDLVVAAGWYEAPAEPGPYSFHQNDFHPGGAQMVVADLDGDGLADVVGSAAHDYGLWWFRQDPPGVFTRILVDDSFSELHACAFADLDGDGRPELITGKRWYAHGGDGPGGQEPAVLYVFRVVRDPGALGGVRWVRETVDENSGVGTQLTVADVDADGRPDLVIANKKGMFLFTQR